MLPCAPLSNLLRIVAGSGIPGRCRGTLESRRVFWLEFQDRVLYGRDYFDNAHQEFLNGLGAEQDVLDKIYFRNALRLLGEGE